jgi:hypothetical protein
VLAREVPRFAEAISKDPHALCACLASCSFDQCNNIRVTLLLLLLLQVLAREVSRFAEALSQDPDAKWPLLMTARLKEAQLSLRLCEEGLGGQQDPQNLRAEVQGLYKRLAELDPMRAGYYADAAAGKAFVVVQALGTV